MNKYLEIMFKSGQKSDRVEMNYVQLEKVEDVSRFSKYEFIS